MRAICLRTWSGMGTNLFLMQCSSVPLPKWLFCLSCCLSHRRRMQQSQHGSCLTPSRPHHSSRPELPMRPSPASEKEIPSPDDIRVRPLDRHRSPSICGWSTGGISTRTNQRCPLTPLA
ncbi:hypothetical protein BJY00DRAFT_261996 [Aspergillus carlsbadensis]|nr:hypothetical protein BJY00DRAFT_261996 [Aspergillus carlsbadensis]